MVIDLDEKLFAPVGVGVRALTDGAANDDAPDPTNRCGIQAVTAIERVRFRHVLDYFADEPGGIHSRPEWIARIQCIAKHVEAPHRARSPRYLRPVQWIACEVHDGSYACRT